MRERNLAGTRIARRRQAQRRSPCDAERDTDAPQPVGEKRPASEAIAAVANVSSSVSGGRMPGRRCASIDFPVPGGPIISRL